MEVKTLKRPARLSKTFLTWADSTREQLMDARPGNANEGKFLAWLRKELARLKTCENCEQRFIAARYRQSHCSMQCYHASYYRERKTTTRGESE